MCDGEREYDVRRRKELEIVKYCVVSSVGVCITEALVGVARVSRQWPVMRAEDASFNHRRLHPAVGSILSMARGHLFDVFVRSRCDSRRTRILSMVR